MRQEIRNTRQYAAKELASVRVLPGIAGYCRVMGPGEIRRAELVWRLMVLGVRVHHLLWVLQRGQE